jgi:hypothetical protein
MTLNRILRATLTGVAAAAVVVPLANAAQPDLVQVGGELVAPAQLSSAQLSLGSDDSTRLVQIGGELVRPARLATWQSRPIALRVPRISSSSSSSFSWGDAGAGAGVGAAAVILLLGSTAVVVRKRRVATA